MTKAHLRYERFRETSYFVIKGRFDATNRLYSGRLLLFVSLDCWENWARNESIKPNLCWDRVKIRCKKMYLNNWRFLYFQPDLITSQHASKRVLVPMSRFDGIDMNLFKNLNKNVGKIIITKLIEFETKIIYKMYVLGPHSYTASKYLERRGVQNDELWAYRYILYWVIDNLVYYLWFTD